MEASTLPCEMIFEILSRSSLETLQRCKRASKSMKRIIYGDPTFLPLHCQRTNTLFGYFFQDIDRHVYMTAFISDHHSRGAAAAMRANWPYNDLKILASSDEGILLCRRQDTRSYAIQYYVCKPATNQWQLLPTTLFTHGPLDAGAVVVLKSNPLRYIILLLSGSNCEIFDSETWAWEEIECRVPYDSMVHPCHASITMGQSVNWLTIKNDVLRFDITKRCFRCFPLPKMDSYWDSKQLLEYEGGLGFVGTVQGTNGNCMELWVAEGERWRRKTTADMTAALGPQPVDFCSSDVVFVRGDDATGFYNLRDGSFRGVEVPSDFRDPSPRYIFRFRSDFEIVQLRGGRRDYV